MEWGTLVIFGGLALLLDSLRESLDSRGVAEPWVRVTWFAEWATILTRVGPKVLSALGDILETAMITLHDIAYAARHGSRRPRQGNDPSGPEG
jgi:hypothetical protein